MTVSNLWRKAPVSLLICAFLAWLLPLAGLVLWLPFTLVGLGPWIFGSGAFVYGIIKWATTTLIFWLIWRKLSTHAYKNIGGGP